MEDIKKLWYRPKEVAELTGLTMGKVRAIADNNPSYCKVVRRHRKIHYTLVELLTKIKL